MKKTKKYNIAQCTIKIAFEAQDEDSLRRLINHIEEKLDVIYVQEKNKTNNIIDSLT